MKIALVLVKPPAYSETFLVSKIEGLQKQGIEVILITNTTKTSYPGVIHKQNSSKKKHAWQQAFSYVKEVSGLVFHLPKVLRYIQLERKEGASTTTLIKKIYLNATLLKLRVDWVHFGFATLAIDRELVAKAIGAKMGVSFRGFDIAIYPLKNPGIYKLLWKYIDKVHTISSDLLNRAFILGLNPETPHMRITPAIDTSFFKSDSNIVFDFKRGLKLLTVARYNWKKGLIHTLEALKILQKKGIKFHYTIIGAGSRAETERVLYTIHELGLKDHVTLTGKLDRENILEYYKENHIYIQYSISEGFCNAVLEAQSLGNLCIVSNAEGLSENVLDKKTGWVIARNNPQLLADKIEEVSNLPVDLLGKIAQEAQHRVHREFNLIQQKKAFYTFFNDGHD